MHSQSEWIQQVFASEQLSYYDLHVQENEGLHGTMGAP
jgi:hypothetical protein